MRETNKWSLTYAFFHSSMIFKWKHSEKGCNKISKQFSFLFYRFWKTQNRWSVACGGGVITFYVGIYFLANFMNLQYRKKFNRKRLLKMRGVSKGKRRKVLHRHPYNYGRMEICCRIEKGANCHHTDIVILHHGGNKIF